MVYDSMLNRARIGSLGVSLRERDESTCEWPMCEQARDGAMVSVRGMLQLAGRVVHEGEDIETYTKF